jgi:small membrane protein
VSGFQRLALLVVTALAALSMYVGWRRPGSRWASALWLALWAGAALALLHPELTQTTARALGIQRGADLVFYCAVLAMLAGFFAVSLRLRQHERETTLLVRHLALREVSQPPERSEPSRDLELDVWDADR